MARRYRKRSKRKQEESLGELLATATAIITLFVTKGNLVATLIMMLIVGVGVPLIIKVYKQNKKKERYLTSGMADIDQMSGEEFEELLKYHFQEQGYKAQLTPKSHDYGADLVLKNGYGETIVVQAKRYGSTVGIKAIQEVIGARSYYNAQRAIVFTNNYFSNSAEQLAETSGVELYDRSELTQFIGGNNIRSFVSAAYTQAQPSQQAQEPQSCPYCGGTLVKRYGKHGAFWGCSNFPTCRYTKNI
jgi:restriction system protein